MPWLLYVWMCDDDIDGFNNDNNDNNERLIIHSHAVREILLRWWKSYTLEAIWQLPLREGRRDVEVFIVLIEWFHMFTIATLVVLIGYDSNIPIFQYSNIPDSNPNTLDNTIDQIKSWSLSFPSSHSTSLTLPTPVFSLLLLVLFWVSRMTTLHFSPLLSLLCLLLFAFWWW